MANALMDRVHDAPKTLLEIGIEYDRLTKGLITKLILDAGEAGIDRTELFAQVRQAASDEFPQFRYDADCFELDLGGVQRKHLGLYESMGRIFIA